MSRFEEGDVIEVRGHQHRVEQVDFHVRAGDESVLQYRLEALGDAPPATLKPNNGREEDEYSISEYYKVTADDIKVVD